MFKNINVLYGKIKNPYDDSDKEITHYGKYEGNNYDWTGILVIWLSSGHFTSLEE